MKEGRPYAAPPPVEQVRRPHDPAPQVGARASTHMLAQALALGFASVADRMERDFGYAYDVAYNRRRGTSDEDYAMALEIVGNCPTRQLREFVLKRLNDPKMGVKRVAAEHLPQEYWHLVTEEPVPRGAQQPAPGAGKGKGKGAGKGSGKGKGKGKDKGGK